MCFGHPADPPPLPPPDPGLQAQKVASFQDTAQRLADQKQKDIDQQRGLVYGLFGSRSLLSKNDSGGLLQAAG